MSRRKYRLHIEELERAQEEERRRADEAWAEHQAVLDRIEAERALPMSQRTPPRIRRL